MRPRQGRRRVGGGEAKRNRRNRPPQPLPLVQLDAEALAQAFTNLLDNAARYSGVSRQIRVTLTYDNADVALAVTDFGIGIAPNEQEKIFEKFYRVSTGLVHDVKGSGLGLAIVQHIVKAHAGRITVASQPGRGSTFTIHLPVSETTLAGTALNVTTANLPAHCDSSGRKQL